MADKKDPKKEALETASIISDALSSIAAQVSDIFANALAGTDRVAQTVTKDIQRRFNDMAKVTDDIASNALKLKDGLIKTDTIEKQILNRKIKQEALGSQLVTLLKQQGVAAGNIEDLIEGQNNGTIRLTRAQKALVNEYAKSKGFNDDYISQLEEQLDKAEEIENSVGITGKVLKGLSKIPVVGQFIDAEKAVNAANKAAADGAGKLGSMAAAFGSLGKSLLSSFTDPLASIGLLIKLFKELIDLGFAADNEVTNLSKSMAISKEEASGVRDRMIEIQNSSESLFMTTKNQVAAQLELANAFGATRGFSEQQVADQVKLTKQIGLSAEEAAGLQQLALANNQTANDIENTVIKQTAALARQKGIQLDNKKILGEVSKVSGQLRLQYANNPALIAKAVVQTEKLGVSLEQAKNMASQLLDFESSIENELSAELLTGKNLNLERARGLALNGDSAAAVEEMAKQVGTAADFTKMNVIQQESLAKAVGMSSDELANSLIARENLNKLGDQTKQQIEEQIELAKQQGDMDKVNMLQRSLGNEAEAKKALEQIAAQERFNAAMEKLKSMVASIVEGPMGKFVDYITKLLSDTNKLKTILTAIKAVAIGLAVAFAIMNPIAAAAGLLIAGSIYAMSGDDIVSPAPGGSGYGKRTLFGPEGAIQLNDKDTVIAGTNLFGDDVKSEPGKSTQMGNQGDIKIKADGGNMSAVVDAIIELRRDVNALANRPINVSIDGKKVIEATTGNQPNTTGEESRKNSYRVS
jgi:hypothetical protein